MGEYEIWLERRLREEMRELNARIKELEDGSCNCRTKKEAWMAGAEWGIIDGSEAGTFLDMEYKKQVLNKAYKEWSESGV